MRYTEDQLEQIRIIKHYIKYGVYPKGESCYHCPFPAEQPRLDIAKKILILNYPDEALEILL